MQVLISALVVTLSLSTGVLSDIPDGEWIAPGIDIKLVESIDVSVYGEPLGNMLGRVSFVETEECEKWRLVLVNTDNITILQEGTETRQIPYSFEADSYVMSPDNDYVVFVKRHDFDYCSACRINTNTGEIEEFQPYPHGSYLGAVFVSNTGSIISSHEDGISFFNSDLVLRINLEEYAEKGNNRINRNSDGSLVFITDGTDVLAYDIAGNIMWCQSEIRLTDGSYSYQRIVISEDSSRLVLTGRHSTVLLDSATGEVLWVKERDRGIATSKSIFSPSGDFLFLGSFRIDGFYLDEQEGFVDVISDTDNWTNGSSAIYRYSQGSQILILPFSASDNGMFLCKASGRGFTDRFLLDSQCNLLWSERSTTDERFVSGAPYGGPGSLSRDGQGMCQYSGGMLNVYRIGAI